MNVGRKGARSMDETKTTGRFTFVPFKKHNYDDRIMGEEMDGCTGG
jgi:hypothetical protein